MKKHMKEYSEGKPGSDSWHFLFPHSGSVVSSLSLLCSFHSFIVWSGERGCIDLSQVVWKWWFNKSNIYLCLWYTWIHVASKITVYFVALYVQCCLYKLWPTLWLRTVLFWVITQEVVEIPYRCFCTAYWSHLQGSRWKMGPIGCCEMSVRNCHYTVL
jgi:hypothetical protein